MMTDLLGMLFQKSYSFVNKREGDYQEVNYIGYQLVIESLALIFRSHKFLYVLSGKSDTFFKKGHFSMCYFDAGQEKNLCIQNFN